MVTQPQGQGAEILKWLEGLSVPDLQQVLPTLWTNFRGPIHAFGKAACLSLFKRAGFLTNGPELPTQPLTIYRGEIRRPGQHGISWTTNERVARSYARGYTTVDVTVVVSATVQPGSILATFSEESEVVVDPDSLGPIKEEGQFPYFPPPQFLIGRWWEFRDIAAM